ncbi:MAG: hypothetical protein IKB31_08280 [Bacteroidaceae bacterium]|nr:hypothetical protein [Bacteroidaceae bacterium]
MRPLLRPGAAVPPTKNGRSSKQERPALVGQEIAADSSDATDGNTHYA